MNSQLTKLVEYMKSHKIYGAKHIPEELIINSRTRHLSKSERKEFLDAYHDHEFLFHKLKKRTGRGSEWHISLNVKELANFQNIE